MTKKTLLPAISAFLIISMFSFTIEKQTTFSVKEIEQSMAKVNDNLYACKYEVTNSEYRFFLNELDKTDPAKAITYQVDSAKWIDPVTYQEPMARYYHRHPAYNNYPVVNISYESAMAYCKWLTEKYNADEKRKFKTVKFVLPSEEEWVTAACGGKQNAIYPWGSNYSLRAKQGEFLCNFKHIGDAFIVGDDHGDPTFSKDAYEKIANGLNDAAFYTANVKSFWPNAFGIYNMSGNVAEMVVEKGLTKGGSWNSYGGEVTIQSKKIYNETSPEVGFRVFMKILPE